MLEIKCLKRNFGQTVAVDNIDLSISDNTVIALYGKNQSLGTTTLINLLSGHLQPDSGEIMFNGQNIIPLNPCQRKELGLSYVAQEDYLFDELTIADHVLAVARNSTTTVNELYAQWRMDSQFLKKSFTALARAGIDVPMETKIKDLPSLKKKLLTLGLAMLEPFKLLVWEDPFKEIEADSYQEITKMINELQEEHKTILFTCNELDIAQQITDQIFVIEDGKISPYDTQ
ncbi:MAG: ATP-binding cassette domain-containing protein [Gammaproteobacteria bacterium]|nr:ATP-binding cassette domain-containing protein [Gammaproteobacteria bacterium]